MDAKILDKAAQLASELIGTKVYYLGQPSEKDELEYAACSSIIESDVISEIKITSRYGLYLKMRSGGWYHELRCHRDKMGLKIRIANGLDSRAKQFTEKAALLRSDTDD